MENPHNYFVLNEGEEQFFNKFESEEAIRVIAVVRMLQENPNFSIGGLPIIDMDSFIKNVEVGEDDGIFSVFSNTYHKFYVFEEGSMEEEDFYEYKIRRFLYNENEEYCNEKMINYYKSQDPTFEIIYSFPWGGLFSSEIQSIVSKQGFVTNYKIVAEMIKN